MRPTINSGPCQRHRIPARRYVLRLLCGVSNLIIDMKKEELQKIIKAVKIRAVAQFATAHNNEVHDKQWALSKAPNPNKEVRTQIVVWSK